MRSTAMIMGMPITVDVVGAGPDDPVGAALRYFQEIDARFSPYKPDSEVSEFNRGKPAAALSREMREILDLAEDTTRATDGYFDIRRPDGNVDPSGLVKGWAIRNAARLIAERGYGDYFVDAGGDIQCSGHNGTGKPWRVGIRNPFDARESIKTLQPGDAGVATSGSYVRGAHIYNPRDPADSLTDIVSVTVVARDIYDADRFATAAFAMGRGGIDFIEKTAGLEGYAVDRRGIATMTSGFKKVVAPC